MTKAFNIKKILFVLALALPFLILTCNIVKVENNAIFIAKHSIMKVETASMSPAFKVNSLVIIKKENFNKLEIGDVIAYKAVALNNALAFHRIIRIEEQGIITKGDNNPFEDNQYITEDSYFGKAVASTNSFAKFITLISQKNGVLYYLILPFCSLFTIYLIIKLGRRKENEDTN